MTGGNRMQSRAAACISQNPVPVVIDLSTIGTKQHIRTSRPLLSCSQAYACLLDWACWTGPAELGWNASGPAPRGRKAACGCRWLGGRAVGLLQHAVHPCTPSAWALWSRAAGWILLSLHPSVLLHRAACPCTTGRPPGARRRF